MTKTVKSVDLEHAVERNCEAVECPECNGFAAEVPTTEEELKRQGCGRSWPCCIAAFVCKRCSTRIFAHRNAPKPVEIDGELLHGFCAESVEREALRDAEREKDDLP